MEKNDWKFNHETGATLPDNEFLKPGRPTEVSLLLH
jgi:hypothetical protein